VKLVQTDSTGHYTIEGLPPGKYNLAIVPDDIDDPRDPSLFARLAISASVTLTRGSTQSLNLSESR
jgi:hypothetical protein